MGKYTHIFHEAGNGFPCVGDDVLIEDDSGWHQIKRVTAVSPIHTRQWQANWIYLTLEDADRNYDDLTEAEQDEAWNDLHHVSLISDAEAD